MPAWPVESGPLTVNPKNRLPGVTEQYATIMELGGVARPLLVTSFDGRPIKIEGNPTHPFSATVPDKIGSADAMAQWPACWSCTIRTAAAKSWTGRSIPRWCGAGKIPRSVGSPDTETAWLGRHGLAVLSETTSSPTTLRLKAKFLKAFPSESWHEYEPLSNDNELAGAKMAFGTPRRVVLQLDRAAVIVSFDADLLGTHPAHTKYASDWSARRRSADQGEMNRVYIAESCLSITGTVADAGWPRVPRGWVSFWRHWRRKWA